MRILIAEDEHDLNDLIAQRLTKEHYSVDSCYDGEEAIDYIRMADYDAIILDIMMPKIDGLTVLRTLRENGNNVAVLLLTAKDSIDDRVKGLDAGADDYLIKPFAFEELSARLRVLLRTPQQKQNELRVGDLCVSLDTHQVTRSGKEITLSSKEYTLLCYMMRNAGNVLTRERLEQHVWNYDYTGASNVIDVYIRHLRKKIDDGFDQKLIHTIRGHGYVLKETA
ncbi:response regulator transcription factor [Merdibacter massiliensis]|uniref:response regulator transcription factor n=1 Tax=Merdibacter massiliensis TaxID=1871030 RepID=UPI00096AB573|nr:response regulator transcription factor [Merdibacter massiliensis]